jgi:hypothetical protein
VPGSGGSDPSDSSSDVARAAAAALAALTEAAEPRPSPIPTAGEAAGEPTEEGLRQSGRPMSSAPGQVDPLPGDGASVDRAERLAALTAALGRSARTAGVGALGSGRWLAETVVDLGGHIPVREHEVLSARHGDVSGDPLADSLIRTAGRASASVGAAAGALLAAQELIPLTWLTVPLELAIETALVAGLEMKLAGELQSAYGHPVAPAGSARAYALARTWADRRGVGPADLVGGVPGVAEILGFGARNELIRLVRRRLIRRVSVNLSQLAPVLVGAAAGAAVNGRATRQFGETVRSTLRP